MSASPSSRRVKSLMAALRPWLPRGKGARQPKSVRLRLEALERREVPAVTPFLVKDINPGSVGSFAPAGNETANVNGVVFFTANDGVNGVELWKSDGTASGTTLV